MNDFTECEPGLTERDLAAVEDTFGVRIPPEMRTHYLRCNGGVPTRRCWIEQGEDPLCLKRFLAIEPLSTAGQSPGDDTLQATLKDLLDGPHIPPDLIPFADDWGGNYFCVDQDSGVVYWFAMDMGDDFERARKRLTNSFTTFVAELAESEEE